MQILTAQFPESGEYRQLEHGNTLYVHFHSGLVVQIAPATAVQVMDHEIIALDGGVPVATFRREDILFATDAEMEPPGMD